MAPLGYLLTCLPRLKLISTLQGGAAWIGGGTTVTFENCNLYQNEATSVRTCVELVNHPNAPLGCSADASRIHPCSRRESCVLIYHEPPHGPVGMLS